MFTSDSGEQRARARGGRMKFRHILAAKLGARATVGPVFDICALQDVAFRKVSICILQAPV